MPRLEIASLPPARCSCPSTPRENPWHFRPRSVRRWNGRWVSAIAPLALAVMLAAGCRRAPSVVPATPTTTTAPAGAVAAPSRLTQADIALWARLLAASDARRLGEPLLDSVLRAAHPRLRAAGALAAGQAG